MSVQAPEQTPMPADAAPVLEATSLTKHFVVRSGVRRSRDGGKRVVHAAEDVSVSLVPGKIIAVVGESGSGKTTVGRMMTRLEIPTKGDLKLRGQDVPKRGARALRPFRSQVQMVFQDPFASLNNGHTVSYHLERPLLIHGIAKNREEAKAKALALLKTVHLEPAEQYIDKYPTQLSGGQRQRVAIARALAVDPAVIVADEPVSMLDVSIRLSVLNLFGEIARSGHAILYITHDIASARYFADEVMVMYAGQVVEYGPAEEVTTDPQHPYTQLLVESAPDPSRRDTRTALAARAGEASSLVTPPSGCRFHPRCPHAMDICSQEQPPNFPGAGGGEAACWLLRDGAAPPATSPEPSSSQTSVDNQ
jgi:peptide/nickel transport system ATP-binding protein